MSTVDDFHRLSREALDLMEHEKVIEQGLASFIEVGWALHAIREGKKYRYAGFATFEDYCRGRWEISRPRAYQMISAASIADTILSTKVDTPQPEREAQVRPLALLKSDNQRREAWQEAVEEADGGQPTAAEVAKAVAKRQPQKSTHPATFSDAILDKIAEHVGPANIVLDPFAGTGRVHELRDLAGVTTTIGVEIEADWEDQHPDNIEGNALHLSELVAAESVDAIATSPSYGNRMADHHDAADDSDRATYRHRLGHELHTDNSGAMQWGPEYRAFHEDAWAEAVRALKPGGTFTLNIKNHIRDGDIQRVAEWHISTLMLQHDLEMIALDVIPTRGLPAGSNAGLRVSHELVVTFRKGNQ